MPKEIKVISLEIDGKEHFVTVGDSAKAKVFLKKLSNYLVGEGLGGRYNDGKPDKTEEKTEDNTEE